jgi:hypothetical protein
MKTMVVRSVAAALLLFLCVLSFTGNMDTAIDWTGRGHLRSANEAYLTEAFQKAISGFGVMSLLKAGLDIIEGSKVGASFGVTAQVEIGDAVQPAYDYVDIAWRTLLTGSVSLLGIRYILQATDFIDSYVLGFAFLIAAVAVIFSCFTKGFHQIRSIMRDILSLALVLVLALYYILPLSVWGASVLSRNITAPAITEAEQGFQQTQQELFPEPEADSKGTISTLMAIPERISRIVTYLTQKSQDLVVWTIQLIAGYIFDCIVFPLTLFALLLWLTRGFIRYVFQKNFQKSLVDDIRGLLAPQRGFSR